MSTALTAAGPHPLRPQNFSELMEFAKMAARSTLVPRDYLGKPENIVLAIQMGSEIGLAPMQSLQNISVINGRPAVWGDAMLGLCRQSPVCKDVVERFEGEGANLTAVCIAKRVGSEPIERRFSMDDAVRAGLASKAGTWQQYPSRMLQHRARGFALRDAFPDVLKGLIAVEEAQDIPEEKHTGQTIEGTATDARAEINKSVPLNPVPRAARVAERAPAYETPKPHPQMPNGPVDPNPVDASTASFEKRTWSQWKDALEIAVRDARTPEERGLLLAKAEIVEIVRLARLGPYSPAKARIIELYEEVENRYLADPPDPPEPEGEELPEVEITGADKMAAG